MGLDVEVGLVRPVEVAEAGTVPNSNHHVDGADRLVKFVRIVSVKYANGIMPGSRMLELLQ